MARCICCESKYDCGCKDINQLVFDNADLEKELEKYKGAYLVLKAANDFYKNPENCNNPEGCFIYETESDGEEISDEGYTAREAAIKAESILGEGK